MILGIGIDSIEIARLAPWVFYSEKELLRVFHKTELTYAFASPLKTAERLAARFAAREACFKALAQHCAQPLPFLTICKAIHVENQPSGAPKLIVDWDYFAHNGHYKTHQNLTVHISLTHTKTVATALVIIERSQ